jgi:hypothetical protein
LWWVWNVAVTVAAADAAVQIVNTQFGALVATHFPTLIDSLLLGFVMAAGALATTPLYIPAAIGVMNDVMGWWTFSWFHGSSKMWHMDKKYSYSELQAISTATGSQAHDVWLLRTLEVISDHAAW